MRSIEWNKKTNALEEMAAMFDVGCRVSRLVCKMSNSNSDNGPHEHTSIIDGTDLPGQSRKGVYQIKTEEQYK